LGDFVCCVRDGRKGCSRTGITGCFDFLEEMGKKELVRGELYSHHLRGDFIMNCKKQNSLLSI
jgi:hypothetical protein